MKKVISISDLSQRQKELVKNFHLTNNWYITFMDLGKNIRAWEITEPNSLLSIYNAYLFAKRELIEKNSPLTPELIDRTHSFADPDNKELKYETGFGKLGPNTKSDLDPIYMDDVSDISKKLNSFAEKTLKSEVVYRDREPVELGTNCIYPNLRDANKAQTVLNLLCKKYEKTVAENKGNSDIIGNEIMELRQALELYHFFRDYNTRTWMVITKVLLEKNGLAPIFEDIPTYLTLRETGEKRSLNDKLLVAQQRFLDFLEGKKIPFGYEGRFIDSKFTDNYLKELYSKESIAYNYKSGAYYFNGTYRKYFERPEQWQEYILPDLPKLFPNGWNPEELESRVKPVLRSKALEKAKELGKLAPIDLIKGIAHSLEYFDKKEGAISVILDYFKIDPLEKDCVVKAKLLFLHNELSYVCVALYEKSRENHTKFYEGAICGLPKKIQIKYELLNSIFSGRGVKEASQKFLKETFSSKTIIKITAPRLRNEERYLLPLEIIEKTSFFMEEKTNGNNICSIFIKATRNIKDGLLSVINSSLMDHFNEESAKKKDLEESMHKGFEDNVENEEKGVAHETIYIDHSIRLPEFFNDTTHGQFSYLE